MPEVVRHPEDRVDEISVLAEAQWDMAEASPSHAAKVVQHYTALDNMWSALLVSKGIEPPYNHKRKLELVRNHFPTISAETVRGLTVNDLYAKWLELRYESTTISPGLAIDFHLLGSRLWTICKQEIGEWAVARGLSDHSDRPSSLAIPAASSTMRIVSEHQRATIASFVAMMKPSIQDPVPATDQVLAATCPASYIRVSAFCDRSEVREDLGSDERFAKWLVRLHDEFYGLVMVKSAQHKGKGVNDDWALNVALTFHGPPAVRIVSDLLERAGKRDPRERLDRAPASPKSNRPQPGP